MLILVSYNVNIGFFDEVHLVGQPLHAPCNHEYNYEFHYCKYCPIMIMMLFSWNITSCHYHDIMSMFLYSLYSLLSAPGMYGHMRRII